MLGSMKRSLVAVSVALTLATAACSSGSSSETSDAPATEAPATETVAAETTVAVADAPPATEAAAVSSTCVVSGSAAATGDPIKIGSIQGKTGPDDFSSSGQGAKAFFDCVNANGGINGRPVELLIEDDQWTPDVAAQAAAKLLNDEKVVAFVGSSSFVECGQNAQTYIDAGIAVVAGTGVPRECFFSKNISPTNSGPRLSAVGAAQYMATKYSAKTAVCIAQAIPNVGEWACGGVKAWGEANGLTVDVQLHDPANPDFPAIVQGAMKNSPDVVLVMEPAGLAIPILKEAEAQGAGDKAHFGGPTSQYIAGWPEKIGSYWNGKFDVQIELNEIGSTGPDNVAWAATMDKYGQSTDPRDTFSQAGWLAAKIFTETLLKMDPAAITRESVYAAIAEVKNFRSDLMCSPWYFGPGERHNANHAGRMVQIDAAGKYTLTQDCQEIPDPELTSVFADEKANSLVG